MFERLAGKNTIITGASAGFGKSTALLFAKYGSNLILTARRENLLQELKDEISKINPAVKVHLIKLDVTDHAAINEEFAKLPEWASKIDILVNNAGLAYGMDQLKDVPESSIDIMLNTNVKGLIWMAQQVLPKMIEANEGHIINIGSIAGLTSYPNGSIYAATKHAVHAISDALRMETNATKIRVTELCPGMVKTEFSKVRFGGDEAKADNVYAGIEPMTGDDIAEMIAFCATRHQRCVISNLVCLANGQANPFMVHRDL
ncbi:hypothetical protein BB559_003859 [Furculomyces boomerangus]|uniref:Uncharacterized protein n=2 Tax=Harpellales TaxID=61421 RepID=A0A2T9YIH0_9FUNG|nr:hypothetical protein BB559_003859 [Furculomyces boomerangus]PWA00517.1 hypothetical protein BB558_003446 [Smittium angustum]